MDTRGNRELACTVAADTQARIGFDADGYAELWIESIRLQRNVPPIPSYTTGMLLPARSPTAQARFRTGTFLEAEDIVAHPAAFTPEDSDGAGSACPSLPPRTLSLRFSVLNESDERYEPERGLDHRIPNGTPLANYRFYLQKVWEMLSC